MRVTNHWLLTFSIPTYGADSKPAHKYERKPAMPNANRHRGTGRIRPHQRDADFTGTLLGESLHLSEERERRCPRPAPTTPSHFFFK